jgi:hypothetical protein
MTNEEQDKLLRQLADTFINVANEHSERHDKNIVNTAFMYAASRFSAFVSASSAGSLEQYKSREEAAIDFFSDEFKKMLAINLKNYEKVFQQIEENKYSEFMKKDDS